VVDLVNNPPHYQTDKGLEAIDVIEQLFPYNYHLANMTKYVLRHKKKGRPIEDLKKAQWYLNRYIQRYGSNENTVWATLIDKKQFFSEVEEVFGLPSMLEEVLSYAYFGLSSGTVQIKQHYLSAAYDALTDYISVLESKELPKA
jgi:Protein of unknwon function (DUF3310)